MKREKAIETINELPREFDLDELIEKLVFVEKVERGLKHLDEQKTIPHETVNVIAKKPFQNFKFDLDRSGPYREKWFEFKKNRMIEWVKKQIDRGDQ